MNTARASSISPSLQRVCEAHPQLSREEEHDLAVRAKKGDRGARDKLFRHHLSWCVSLAHKWRLGTVDIEDVIHEGVTGLAEAINHFNPDAGTRLATYAVWWIRVRMLNFLRVTRSSVRPRAGLNAVHDDSLDVTLGEGGETFLDMLPSNAVGHDEIAEREDYDHRVRSVLARLKLKPLERDIVETRLCRGDEADTLVVIGNRHGVSRERVRQVELQVKAKLADYLPEMLDEAPAPMPVPAPAPEEDAPAPGPRHPLVAMPCPEELVAEHIRYTFPEIPEALIPTALTMALGFSTKETAIRLGIETCTAHTKRNYVFDKVNIHTCEQFQSALLAVVLERIK